MQISAISVDDIHACVEAAPAFGPGVRFFSLRRFQERSGRAIDRLPFLRRLLIENLGRALACGRAQPQDRALLLAIADGETGPFPFLPARLLLQDASGIPLLQDFVALQETRAPGRDRLSLALPATLVVDHGTEIHSWGHPSAADDNLDIEYRENDLRYRFLKWCEGHISGLSVTPPGSGIVHSVNLEHLCTPLVTRDGWLYPDSVIGSDSHTTMTNGAGVLSWGAGGIDMIGLMVGHATQLTLPPVIRLELRGAPLYPAGAADVAYALAEFLRAEVAPGSVIEFAGPGVHALSVHDRATIANMAPEYGAWICYFPVDATIQPLLARRGVSVATIDAMLAHLRHQMLAADGRELDQQDWTGIARTLRFDLASVSVCLAGPGMPWNRRAIPILPAAPYAPAATTTSSEPPPAARLEDGGIVLAAIASCTTTSNPRLLIEAALLARQAAQLGLAVAPHIKTSFSPGSPELAGFLREHDLLQPLERLGFAIAAYGCGSCVGNSGALHASVEPHAAASKHALATVISGNRNFSRRIHPLITDNYLTAPAMVVAYAIAGNIKFDFTRTPVGVDKSGTPVFLRDLRPAEGAVRELERAYANGTHSGSAVDTRWAELDINISDDVPVWQALRPRFEQPPFAQPAYRASVLENLTGARCLAAFGDDITTDHISPLGAIPNNSAAALFLAAAGTRPEDMGSFLGWRGNHRVMRLGTFSHRALRNLLLPNLSGPLAMHATSGICAEIPVVSHLYEAERVPLVLFAGHRYGAGSARDWAAKGTRLLGVRVVVAASFERIHRSNLVALGVVPLLLPKGANPIELGLAADTSIDIRGLAEASAPDGEVDVVLKKNDGTTAVIRARLALASPFELNMLRSGGVMGLLCGQSQPAQPSIETSPCG